jgi:hypothetical protein
VAVSNLAATVCARIFGTFSGPIFDLINLLAEYLTIPKFEVISYESKKNNN